MLSGIAIPVIIEAAKRVGAPIVKAILEKHIGTAGAEIATGTAEKIIETVAKNAGVEPAELPTLSPGQVDGAVIVTETQAPELIAEWNRTLELAVQLQEKEMETGPMWTWAWRPAWMWLLAFFWTWALIIQPAIWATVGSDFGIVDLAALTTLTAAYLALYMGGHTVKDVFGKR